MRATLAFNGLILLCLLAFRLILSAKLSKEGFSYKRIPLVNVIQVEFTRNFYYEIFLNHFLSKEKGQLEESLIEINQVTILNLWLPKKSLLIILSILKKLVLSLVKSGVCVFFQQYSFQFFITIYFIIFNCSNWNGYERVPYTPFLCIRWR